MCKSYVILGLSLSAHAVPLNDNHSARMAAPLSKMISIVSHSQTLHKIEQRSASHFAASSTANISSTTKSGFTSQQGAQWSPGDISTVVFGCLATVLGVMTLCFMLWLGRRTSRHETPDGVFWSPRNAW